MMVTVLEELLAGHLAVVGLGVGGHLRLLHVRHRQRVLNIRILSQCLISLDKGFRIRTRVFWLDQDPAYVKALFQFFSIGSELDQDPTPDQDPNLI